MIRLARPCIEQDDIQAVCDTLASGYLVQGSRVAAFEHLLAETIGCQHVVAVSNGTAALHLALQALDVRQGDLIPVTAYSWPATANVIELCGAQPVFIDIQAETFNLDPACLEAVLKRLMATPATAKRVKAILPVHTFGQMADMPSILELAARYTIPVVEDAACALGATLYDRHAGTWGALGCLSFHPRKAITTGEGGAITTDDAAFARRMRTLRNHGQDPEAAGVDFVMPGFNYRLSELQAALGYAQLTRLDARIARRQALARRYDALLAALPVRTPVMAAGSMPVCQSYVIVLPDDLAARRDELIRLLRQHDIETTIGTWHIPLTTYYRHRYGFAVGDFPITDRVFAGSLTLPLHEQLTDSEQHTVVECLREILSQWAATPL